MEKGELEKPFEKGDFEAQASVNPESGGKERIKHKRRFEKPGCRLIMAAAAVCLIAVLFLLANPGSAGEISRLKEQAFYRNGLYLVTSEIKNEEAVAVFQNSLSYYDERVRGEILITDNMPYQYSEDADSSEALWDILSGKYVFTWRDGTTERDLTDSGRSLRQGDEIPVAYGRELDEYLLAGEEDVLVSINITGFEEPLRFIVPAAGTAPAWGMLYGTFAPAEIVYLSPLLAVDDEELLAAAKEAVFTVLPETFSVSCPTYQDVIGDASYAQAYYSDGTALGETVSVRQKPGGDLAPETVSVAEYGSKYGYSVRGDFGEYGYYRIFLLDHRTWIGRWRLYGDPAEVRCDYIFRVEPVDAPGHP